MGVSILPKASKSYAALMGTYTTAAWAAGTKTVEFTAPEDGLYIVWMQFELTDQTAANRNTYKQLQMQTNGTGLITVMQYYDAASSSSDFITRTVCMPFRLAEGNKVWPYVHTGTAGVVYRIQICAIKISDDI